MSSTAKVIIRTTTPTPSTATEDTDYSNEYEEVSTIPSNRKSTTAEKERNIVPLEVILEIISYVK